MPRWVVLLNGDRSQRMVRPRDGTFTGLFAALAAGGGAWETVAEFSADAADEQERIIDLLAPYNGEPGRCGFRRPSIADIDEGEILRHQIVIPSQACA
jgi:hypothetical protein